MTFKNARFATFDLADLPPTSLKLLAHVPVHVAAQPWPGTYGAAVEAECKARIAAIAQKRGAKVVTNAGIIGTVVGAKDGEEEITIRSEDTKLRILRSAVVRVVGTDETEANKT